MMYGVITNNTQGDLTDDTDTRHSVTHMFVKQNEIFDPYFRSMDTAGLQMLMCVIFYHPVLYTDLNVSSLTCPTVRIVFLNVRPAVRVR
jgi:hypothetical protein